MSVVAAALALGLAGSLHCVAMCGPIVAVAGRGPRRVLPYHAGRLATYAVLGALAGAAGGAVARAGLGRGLAIAAGAALLLQALASTRWIATSVFGRQSARHASAMIAAAGAWLRRHRLDGPMTLGALNGLLPCGLLYAALTAAVGLGSTVLAVLFMLGFGLGTTPLLAVVGVTAQGALARMPVRIRRAAPLVLAAVGVLLVLRGLATGPVGVGHAH